MLDLDDDEGDSFVDMTFEKKEYDDEEEEEEDEMYEESEEYISQATLRRAQMKEELKVRVPRDHVTYMVNS